MVHLMFVLNTSLIPFQGFLFVFGGMLDSAYSNSRYPLWVFDIGELLCGDERLAANDKTCCCMSTCEKYSEHNSSPSFHNPVRVRTPKMGMFTF